MQKDAVILDAANPDLAEAAEHLIKVKKAFTIKVNRSFRYYERIERELRISFEGLPDRRWLWTAMRDVMSAQAVLSSRSIAVTDNNYNWHYEHTLEGMNIIFIPPCEGKIDVKRTEYQVVPANDRHISEKVKKLLREKRAFVIRGSGLSCRSNKLVKYLRISFDDEMRNVSSWAALKALVFTRKVRWCHAMAEAYSYRFRYEKTAEGVDLFFDPPDDSQLRNA